MVNSVRICIHSNVQITPKMYSTVFWNMTAEVYCNDEAF